MDLARLSVRLLVVNAGSSSLKLRLLDDTGALAGQVDLAGFDEAEVAGAVRGLEGVDAVAHRVVHGGPRYAGPVLLTDEVVEYLVSLSELAPLHQPLAVKGIRLLRRLLPEAPAYACFDTGFHHGLPAAAATYALPAEWNQRFGLRRYGFHGLSHAYAARRAAEMLGRTGLRVVTCHLGAGASLAAVRDGTSLDTTMGFTPLEGLVMATRAGSVDPGLLLWLQRSGGIPGEELNDALEHRSGLAGLAGTSDLRRVLAARESGDAAAALAFDVYVHRLRALVAAMAAALEGLDALVFTGGVGENAPAVREACATGLGFLGLELDVAANATARPDADVSSKRARVRTLVVQAREDLEAWREVRALARQPA